jgi:hypothetical protein
MCSTNRGYRCYFPSCGISALKNHRERGKPVLFGAHLYAIDSPIHARTILCANHLRIVRTSGHVAHFQPLTYFLETEDSSYTRGLVAEQMENMMNIRSRTHKTRPPRMVA